MNHKAKPGSPLFRPLHKNKCYIVYNDNTEVKSPYQPIDLQKKGLWLYKERKDKNPLIFEDGISLLTM